MFPRWLILTGFLLVLLFTLLQLGALVFAFGQLGLSAQSALLLFPAALAGSAINLPLFSRQQPVAPLDPDEIPDLLEEFHPVCQGRTTVAVNVGGALVPICLSGYLIAHHGLPLLPLALAVLLVGWPSYRLSRSGGRWARLPLLLTPPVAAGCANLFAPAFAEPLAYVGATLGLLLGGELARLPALTRLRLPLAAVGGGGTFDASFIAGIVAVLLA